jgi:hypothetical protein
MSHRFLTAVLTATSVVFATHAYADPTTVKGSKSNSSDRMGGGGGVRSGGGAAAGAINGGRDRGSPGTR